MKSDPHSCNKVKCTRCNIAFCWVCGVKISGYEHFNEPNSACYNKLFKGVPGH
jgi:E3 ubiquitin-protein ligase RNF14